MEFIQPPCGPLSLTLGAGPSQRVIHAASLWHLMIGYPEVCRQHLLPLLQLIDSRWDPGKLAADLEEDLIQLARSQDARTGVIGTPWWRSSATSVTPAARRRTASCGPPAGS